MSQGMYAHVLGDSCFMHGILKYLLNTSGGILLSLFYPFKEPNSGGSLKFEANFLYYWTYRQKMVLKLVRLRGFT